MPTFTPNRRYMNPVQYRKIQLLLYEPNRKKFTLEQAKKTQRGSRDIGLLFNFGAGWGGWQTPRPRRFTPWERSCTHCLGGRLALGPVWTGGENVAPTGIRSPDVPARTEPLYLLENNQIIDLTCYSVLDALSSNRRCEIFLLEGLNMHQDAIDFFFFFNRHYNP
jgi:hypothetical protein